MHPRNPQRSASYLSAMSFIPTKPLAIILLLFILTASYNLQAHAYPFPFSRRAPDVDLSALGSQDSHLSNVQEADKHTDTSAFVAASDLEVAQRVLALLPGTYALDVTQDYTLDIVQGHRETDDAALAAQMQDAGDVHAVNAALGPGCVVNGLSDAETNAGGDIQADAHHVEVEGFVESIIVHEEVVLIENICGDFSVFAPWEAQSCAEGTMLEVHELEFWKESEYAKIVQDQSSVREETYADASDTNARNAAVIG